jgi:hypothetical protein
VSPIIPAGAQRRETRGQQSHRRRSVSSNGPTRTQTVLISPNVKPISHERRSISNSIAYLRTPGIRQ